MTESHKDTKAFRGIEAAVGRQSPVEVGNSSQAGILPITFVMNNGGTLVTPGCAAGNHPWFAASVRRARVMSVWKTSILPVGRVNISFEACMKKYLHVDV